MIPPIPCAHCGYNFMRSTPKSDEKLCNNCCIRENIRNPKKEPQPMTVDILIKCPCEVHKEIEEICLETNTSLTNYFLNLHTLTRMVQPQAAVLEPSSKEEDTTKKGKPNKK